MFKSLNSRLLGLFFAISILPILLLGVIYVIKFEDAMKNSARDYVDAIANKKISEINSYIQQNTDKLEKLATSQNVKNAIKNQKSKETEDTRLKLEQYISEKDFYDLLLINKNGDVVFSVLKEEDFGTNLLNGRFKDSLLADGFKDAISSIDTQIGFSKSYAPSAKLLGGLIISTPVTENGQVIGVISAQLDPKVLIEIASDKTGLGVTGESPVSMKVGDDILYMVPLNHIPNAAFRHQVPINSGGVASPMRKAINGEHGSGLTNDYVGIECVAAWRYIPSLNWGIVTKIDKSEAYAPLYDIYKFATGTLIVMMLIISFVAFRFGRAIIRPIDRLTKCAKSIKSQNPTTEMLSPNKKDWSEAYELESSFVQMVGRLQRSREELEDTQSELSDRLLEMETIFNTTKDGLAILDLKSNFVNFNDSYQEMTGFTREELLTKSCIGLSVPEDVERSIKAVSEVLEKGFIKNYEKSCIVKDGKIISIQMSIALMPDSEHLLISTRDVTEKLKADKKLLQSEEYNRALLSGIGEGIYSIDKRGKCTYINDIALDLFELERDAVIGKDAHELFHHSYPDGSHYPDSDCPIYASISHGEVHGSEEWFFKKSGVAFPVYMTASPIHTDEEITGAIVSFRDITVQKEAQNALIEAKQAAEASARAKSEFLANMSHEIRTPMNAILGLTGLVLDGELSAKQRDYLQKINYSSKTLLGILNDILDYSKIEAGKLDINENELNVQTLMHNISNLFMPKIEEKGLELFLDISPDMPRKILADELRLTQVLSNLVSNAIKFTNDGSITISAELVEHMNDRDVIKFAVKDTGIGLDNTQAKKLFQPFTQADGTITRKYGGTGLGLSISQRLVDLMGGSIIVSSQLNAGSTFAFSANVGVCQSSHSGFDIKEINTHRALVVDDQESSITILTKYLTSWKIANDSCMSGEEALNKIKSAEEEGMPYDIVLVDWQMPGISGLDVVDELVNQEKIGTIKRPPVTIMVTAHSKDNLLKEAKSGLLDGILIKPVTPSALFCALSTKCDINLDKKIPSSLADIKKCAAPLKGCNILLVEDNELNQEVAVGILAKFEINTKVANHGLDAIDMVAKEDFDCILMDMHMPVMDGLEATKVIRNMHGKADIPIIAMTAAATEQDKKLCLEAGMDDHLSKPIAVDMLIKMLLKATNNITSQIEIETAEQNITPSGKIIDIEQIKARFLMEHEEAVELILNFASSFEDFEDELSGALSSNNINLAKDLVHKIKGASGNIVANELFKLSGEYEMVIESGDSQMHDKFVSSLRATLSYIKSSFERKKSQTIQKAVASEVINALNILREKVTQSELIEFDEKESIFTPIRNFEFEKSKVKKLEQAVENFDYKVSVSIIEEFFNIASRSEHKH